MDSSINNNLITPPNTICFWAEDNKEIFSVGAKDGKLFLKINPELELVTAATEGAKIFWNQFEKTLNDMVERSRHEKET